MPNDAERVKELEKELSLYKPNGSVALYYELNRFINETVAIMRKNGLESLLKPSKDDDAKKFEKMMALIKNAKEHALDMSEIKTKLKLSGNEDADKDIPFVETVAETRR